MEQLIPSGIFQSAQLLRERFQGVSVIVHAVVGHSPNWIQKDKHRMPTIYVELNTHALWVLVYH